jgi:hypothetical protein
MVKVAVSQMDTLREDWDVAEFKGKPAIELSFRLDIPTEGHEIYYVGYIDVVLRNRWTNRYAVLDAKTTGLKLFDVDPLYKNSTQLIGYSTAIDQIVGQEQAEYDVLYLVGQLPEDTGFFPKIHTLTYAKKLSDRLDFFISLGLDVERLARMLELNSFPRRGGNCLQFFKPCREFGTCHLHAAEFYQDADEEDIEYDFRFSLDDVITDHVARIASLPPSPSVEQESNADGDLISLT